MTGSNMPTSELLILLGTIAGLFIWNRSESRADARESRADVRRCLDLIEAIDKEIKDFHGRLCAIEERNRGK
jgi:hypothetical protein